MQGQRFREVVCKELNNFAANFASWLCRANERGEKIFSSNGDYWWFFLFFFQETKQIFVTMAI